MKIDPRNIQAGREIPCESYCDQPYLLKTDDGAWLCILTTGSGIEGEHGQHVVSLRSEDQGRTWKDNVDLEPADGLEASYAVLLKAISGRVYAFYNHNTDNVREIPAEVGSWFPDGICRRVDSLGYFVFKFSDDHGRSWSDKRYSIPMRLFEIDRENDFEGRLLYFWNVGKPFQHQGAVYVSLHKVGGYGDGFFTRSEGTLLRSPNLLTESDPDKIQWETLPDGDVGIRAPKNANTIAEEQSYVTLSDGSFFVVFRTIAGYAACAYSRDEGRSWSESEFHSFPNGCPIKNPRAANFVWKCENGKYLYWFHNHGGPLLGNQPDIRTTGYNDRNPVWLSGGVEEDSPEGKKIKWSQPEIVLYDDDPYVRMSYPDLIEEGGKYFLSETQKEIARLHELDSTLLEGLWNQFGNEPELVQSGLISEASGSQSLSMPALPAFTIRDESRADYGTKDCLAGITLEFQFTPDAFQRGHTILDTRNKNSQGMVLRVSSDGGLEFHGSDGVTTMSLTCDPRRVEIGKEQHIAIVMDGGPKVAFFIIDGVVDDGGDYRQFGWARFSPHLSHLNGRKIAFLDTCVKGLRIYNRALRVSEVVGNHRFCMESLALAT